jgi:hypothetical protein
VPTIKKGKSATTIVFNDQSYTDKLFAKNVFLDEEDPENLILQVDLSHYSKNRPKNLEGSDFEQLESDVNKIIKFTLRDATIAQNIKLYADIATVEINIGTDFPTKYRVTKQVADHRQVELFFPHNSHMPTRTV